LDKPIVSQAGYDTSHRDQAGYSSSSHSLVGTVLTHNLGAMHRNWMGCRQYEQTSGKRSQGWEYSVPIIYHAQFEMAKRSIPHCPWGGSCYKSGACYSTSLHVGTENSELGFGSPDADCLDDFCSCATITSAPVRLKSIQVGQNSDNAFERFTPTH
jgi:hypothetical protein